MIYTGKTGSIDTTEKDLYYDDDVIYVDMSRQSTGQIPACMESTKYEIDESNNGDTIINFKFENRCAILEIKGITGTKESTDLSEEGPTKLDYINVSNVINAITYSYNDGKPGLGTDGTYKETGVKVSGSIYVDSNGNIVDSNGNSKSVMMAVAPNETKEDIIVSAETSNDTFVASYNTDLVAGNCYVIRQQDVVAKTEDGFYFTTVNAAFSHAAELSGDTSGKYDTAEENIVTLVRDCGLAGVDADDEYNPVVGEGDPINIDGYDVSLDLNGRTLTLAGEDECFYVNGYFENNLGYQPTENKDSFIITDTKSVIGTYVGKISHSGDTHVIINFGELTIDGGEISHTGEWCVVENYGRLTISEGTLCSGLYYAIESEEYYGISPNDPEEATITIGNSKVDAKITISSESDDCEAIYIRRGTLNINEGEIFGSCGAVMLCGSVTDEVEEDIYEIQYHYKPQANITGGYIHADAEGGVAVSVLGGAQCIISGGVIQSKGESNSPAILCYSGHPEDAATENDGTSLTIKWPNDSESDGINIHEPLIITEESSSFWNSPVCIARGEMDPNFAKININGGILYSGNGAFYRQVIPTKDPQQEELVDDKGYLDRLKKGDITSFYANTDSFIYNDTDKLQLIGTADFEYGLKAELQTGSGFQKTIDGKYVSFDVLYKISKEKEE